MSVSFAADLADEIKVAAERRSMTVSAWLAEAARDRLRNEGLDGAIREWEEIYGPITEQEMAKAQRLFDRAAALKRRPDTD